MEQIEFESWWKEFQSNHEKDNDNGRRATTELSWTLKGYSVAKRIAFIDALRRNRKSGYTFELIPIYGNQRQKIGLRITFASGY